MIDVINSIFGPYTLVEGATNYGYIAAVVIFCIVLYGVIRIIGSVLSK